MNYIPMSILPNLDGDSATYTTFRLSTKVDLENAYDLFCDTFSAFDWISKNSSIERVAKFLSDNMDKPLNTTPQVGLLFGRRLYGYAPINACETFQNCLLPYALMAKVLEERRIGFSIYVPLSKGDIPHPVLFTKEMGFSFSYLKDFPVPDLGLIKSGERDYFTARKVNIVPFGAVDGIYGLTLAEFALMTTEGKLKSTSIGSAIYNLALMNLKAPEELKGKLFGLTDRLKVASSHKSTTSDHAPDWMKSSSKNSLQGVKNPKYNDLLGREQKFCSEILPIKPYAFHVAGPKILV
jgi:hypothetical protein